MWNPTKKDIFDTEKTIQKYIINSHLSNEIDLSKYEKQHFRGFSTNGKRKLLVSFINNNILFSGEYYSLAEYTLIFTEEYKLNSYFRVIPDFENMQIESLK